MPKLPVVERRYAVAFALTATLFFAWGLASQFNDLLLHHFQKALDLTRTRASFTQFAFYIGYFCAPLPAAMIIRRIGYKKTIIIGLAFYAVGAFLFVPGAHLRSYGLFLAALYIIAIGAGFLETSAKNATNVGEAFMTMAAEIKKRMASQPALNTGARNTVRPGEGRPVAAKSSCC